MTGDEAVMLGRRVVRLEAQALLEIEQRIDEGFARAVELISHSTGRVLVTGIGKSGLIGRKIAATLTSTGTPATFLHPTESLHGDLGMVGHNDVAILLSKSGESEELLTLLAHLKRFGVCTIALVGNTASSLARECDAVLDASIREEACPHDLAPTTSTTAALALGDALAVTILEKKGFRREDFARLHPGGSLGRKLLMRVREVMETERLPVLAPTATMRDVIVLLASRRGLVVGRNADGSVEGIFTAGDFTRLMQRNSDPFAITLQEAMNRAPKTARVEELASAVVYRMEQFGIMAMPVTDDSGVLVGVIHLHDLMRAGVA
ncbi:MAG: KpsF/GutQ family sugar-phosphate isomerase [Gemmatimonadaceae bacterium]